MTQEWPYHFKYINCSHKNTTHLFSNRAKIPDRKLTLEVSSFQPADLSENNLDIFPTLHREDCIWLAKLKWHCMSSYGKKITCSNRLQKKKKRKQSLVLESCLKNVMALRLDNHTSTHLTPCWFRWWHSLVNVCIIWQCRKQTYLKMLVIQ